MDQSLRTNSSISSTASGQSRDAFAPVIFPSPFDSLSSGFNQAYRETNLLVRRTTTGPQCARAFYRYSYYAASLPATFSFGLSVYDTKNTRATMSLVGLQHWQLYAQRSFFVSQFENTIVNGLTAGLPNPGILLSSGSFFEGPNLFGSASDSAGQSGNSYDGSKTLHSPHDPLWRLLQHTRWWFR